MAFFFFFLQSQAPGGENGTYTINDLSTAPINSPQLFEIVASAIVFQFAPADRDSQSTERIPPYYDKLNSWLGQILQRDISNVQIELCEIEQHGVAIRMCPLENPERPPSDEDIENVVACLEQQVVRFSFSYNYLLHSLENASKQIHCIFLCLVEI